jgi:molybdopterin synthase sulfur carrier subunit
VANHFLLIERIKEKSMTSNKTIKVCYFASLREDLGRGEDQLNDINNSLSVADVWMQATGQETLPTNILMAINHDYVDADSIVNEGDEVAFFPPVTGG